LGGGLGQRFGAGVKEKKSRKRESSKEKKLLTSEGKKNHKKKGCTEWKPIRQQQSEVLDGQIGFISTNKEKRK